LRLFPRIENVVDGLFDAEIDHLVTVVGQDDIDQVFPDVVDVALDRRQYKRALRRALNAFHKRFEKAHRGLHRLSGLQHERQLHLAGTKKIADDLHPVEQQVVDDVERRVGLERLFERVLKPDLFALDYVLLQPLLDRQLRDILLYRLRRFAFEQRRELGQRIIRHDIAVKLSPIVDQVAGGVDLVLVKADERQYL